MIKAFQLISLILPVQVTNGQSVILSRAEQNATNRINQKVDEKTNKVINKVINKVDTVLTSETDRTTDPETKNGPTKPVVVAGGGPSQTDTVQKANGKFDFVPGEKIKDVHHCSDRQTNTSAATNDNNVFVF